MEDTDMKRQKIKNKNFNYFKRRFYRERILQASCLGASIGFVAAAVANLASHKWWVALICGVLSFIASAAFLSWRQKPSDKQVARHLDNTLHLQEKVATRIELKDQDGIIINKQRENAAQILSQCEAPRRSWWQIVITPLALSIAFFIASYFMPWFSRGHGDNIISPNPTVEVVAPPNFNEALEDIENKISEDLEDNSENRDEVISQGKEDIDDLVNKVNSKEEIGDELMKSNDDALKALGEAIKNGDLDKITEAFNQLQHELENLQGQELADKLHQIANEIRKALENSKIPEDDPLRKALNDLADNLDKTANNIEATNSEDSSSKCTVNSEKDSAKESLKKAEEEVKDAVDQQNKNQEAGEQAKDDLDNLGKGGDSNKPSTGGTDGGNNGIQPGKGSDGGSGEINYAGNDHVFTDEGDTTYGDVIDNSNGTAQNDCDHYGDGDINATIDDYFRDLYGNNNP